MKTYEVTMNFTFWIETDDIEKTMREMEFPTFNYPEDENKVEFIEIGRAHV